MFTFKRLLLLLVLAVLAYARMADLQLAASKNWFACGVTTYRIFDTQYHFPPFAAVKAAIDQTRAVALFRSSSDPADKEAAVKPLTQAYAEIKSRTGATFDATTAATQQVQVWSLVETDSLDEAARALAGQLALVHGGDPKKYLPPARDFVAAAASAKSGAWPAAEPSLRKAWTGVQSAAK